MKKHFSKTVVPTILLVIAVFVIGASCNSEPPNVTVQTCDDATPILESIFIAIGNEGTMDLQQHEYKFTSSVNGAICALGYQSLVQTIPFAVDNSNTPYTLEIVEGNGHMVTQIFSSSTIEYADLSSSFPVIAGTEYTIRRTGGDGLNSSMGYIANVPSFPVTQGNIIFNSSNFVDVQLGGGGPVANIGIPKIYIQFLEE
ncbi:hypothetical protein [Kordia sp.]|uniref:hypothetical protein n=1 Tax=Kordia sp. TaxID=1965332 RepID=UPI003B5AA785